MRAFFKKFIIVLCILFFFILILMLIYKVLPLFGVNPTIPSLEEKIDTDGDSLSDNDELNKYFTNPNKKDSDDDGLDDNDEIYKYKSNPNKKDSDDDDLDDKLEIEKGTNPNNNDSDGDGLLDGKAQYAGNKEVAPIDPNPLVANAPRGVWQKHVQIQQKGNIPYYLTTLYQYDPSKNALKDDINIDKLKNSDNFFDELIQTPFFTSLASTTLNFRLDNGGVVMHSQTKKEIYDYVVSDAKKKLSKNEYELFQLALKTFGVKDSIDAWQKQFGYNDLYDEAFRVGTNNNMREGQLYFKDKHGYEHVLWLWRGDYLALGSGAEMGLYRMNEKNSNHWDAVEFSLPMTLSLYDYYSNNNVDHIFSWRPVNKQWWITGFNPKKPDANASRQILIGTIDFSSYKEMYKSLKNNTIKDRDMKNFVIFDDSKYLVWICWYEEYMQFNRLNRFF